MKSSMLEPGILCQLRENKLSSVKDGHLKSLRCWLQVKRHPEEIFYEHNTL